MKPLFAVLVLTACISTPATTVRTPDSRPGLAIEGAPSGATLYVDGNAVGDANAFNGAPAVLRVEPGTHRVDVRDASGKVVFSQRVFVDSETKTLQVH
jgi:hypothetical protein